MTRHARRTTLRRVCRLAAPGLALVSLLLVACGNEDEPRSVEAQSAPPVSTQQQSHTAPAALDSGETLTPAAAPPQAQAPKSKAKPGNKNIPAHLDLSRWTKIKKGQSPQQVRAVLGEPAQILPTPYGSMWMYMATSPAVPLGVIAFQGEKVEQFTAPDPAVLDQLKIDYIPASTSDSDDAAEDQEERDSTVQSPDGAPRHLDLQNWAQVKPGMTVDEVRRILGEPGDEQFYSTVVDWYYKAPTTKDTIGYVRFQSGRVAGVEAPDAVSLRQLGVHPRGGEDPYAGLPHVIDGVPAWFHKERHAMLKQGMTTAQVLAVVGEPTKREENERYLIWWYGWDYDGRSGNGGDNDAFYTLHFDSRSNLFELRQIGGMPDENNARWVALRDSWNCSERGWPSWMDPTHWIDLRPDMEPADIVALLGEPHPTSEKMNWRYEYRYPGATYYATLRFRDEEFPQLHAYEIPNFEYAMRQRRALDGPEALAAPQWAHHDVWRMVFYTTNVMAAKEFGGWLSPQSIRQRLGEPQQETWSATSGPYGETWQRVWTYADGRLVWRTDVSTTVDAAQVMPNEGHLVELHPPVDEAAMMAAAVDVQAAAPWLELLRQTPGITGEDDLFPYWSAGPQPVDLQDLFARFGDPEYLTLRSLHDATKVLEMIADRREDRNYTALNVGYRYENGSRGNNRLIIELPLASNEVKAAEQERYVSCRTWLVDITPPLSRERPGWSMPRNWDHLGQNFARRQHEGVQQPNGLRMWLLTFGEPAQVDWQRSGDEQDSVWLATLWYGDGRLTWRTTLSAAAEGTQPSLAEAASVQGSLLDLVPPTRASIDAVSGGASYKLTRPEYTPPDLEDWPRWFQFERWQMFLARDVAAAWVRYLLGEPSSTEWLDQYQRTFEWRYGPYEGHDQRWNSGYVRFDEYGALRDSRLPQRKD